MLAILIRFVWVALVIDQWLKQRLCVRYFTEFMCGTVGYGEVNNVYTFC